MSSYYEGSTNFTNNPFMQQHSNLKQKLIEQDTPQYTDQNYTQTIAHKINHQNEEDTIVTGKLPNKIKASTKEQEGKPKNKKIKLFDDQETQCRKKTSKKVQSLPAKEEHSLILNQLSNLESIPQKKSIPEPSAQVQSILAGPKMREKYGNLLPKIHQKPISSQQQHLLRIFSMMDETIQFSNKNRAVKFVFFQELRRIIRDSLKVFIDIKHLQQLLYLDESLFEVKWQWSCQKRAYDIMITLPKIKSKDQRKQKVRKILVDFLNEKHKQFLIEKKIQINRVDGPWHPDFQPANYEIPRKTIPVHPETKDAQLRSFDQNKIARIKNQKLKELIQNKKQQSQVQSFKSKSVMDMIFAGVGTKNIQNQILKAVKQKQDNIRKNKILEQQRIEKQKTQIQPEILKQISQNILLIYMSKSVSYMFKVKLIELVKERTNHKFGSYIVDRHVEHIIELKDIGYLKEIVAGKNKPTMLQINKAKAKQITAYAQSLKQQMLRQSQTQKASACQQIQI